MLIKYSIKYLIFIKLFILKARKEIVISRLDKKDFI